MKERSRMSMRTRKSALAAAMRATEQRCKDTFEAEQPLEGPANLGRPFFGYFLRPFKASNPPPGCLRRT